MEIELDEEKSRSKANADSFRQEVAEFSTARDELNNRIESLNKTVELQEDTISSLTTSLARETELRMSTEASSKNKSETVACLKSANEQLQEQLGNMESVDSVRLERQAQLEQQVSNTSASITSLTNQLTELKLANEESRLQNDQLQLTNQTSAQTVLSLERNLQRKEAEMQTLNTKLAQVAQLKTFIKQKEAKIEELLDLNNLLSAKLDDYKQIRDNLASMDELISRMRSEHQDKVSSYQTKLAEAVNNKDVVLYEKELQKEFTRQQSSTAELRQQYSEHIVSLQTNICTVQEKLVQTEKRVEDEAAGLREERDAARAEVTELRKLYDDLQAKIAPLKEQLDAFEWERQALEGQSSNWASEASKAKQEYAKLLGHQNNKQKIRRISQISEENFTHKQEVMNLRSSNSKLKRQLSQQQDKVRQLEGKKRFSPSKAFQGADRENEEPATPFKSTNQ